jgi:hypothetical protein
VVVALLPQTSVTVSVAVGGVTQAGPLVPQLKATETPQEELLVVAESVKTQEQVATGLAWVPVDENATVCVALAPATWPIVATGAVVVVVFVNVKGADGQPVAVLTSEKETSEQEFGVISRVSDCCPLTSAPPVTVTSPPLAEGTTDTVGFVPGEKRFVPRTVTAVEWAPGPELGDGPLVIFGTFTANEADDDADSPVDKSVTVMIPLLLGHPAGGLARI